MNLLAFCFELVSFFVFGDEVKGSPAMAGVFVEEPLFFHSFHS